MSLQLNTKPLHSKDLFGSWRVSSSLSHCSIQDASWGCWVQEGDRGFGVNFFDACAVSIRVSRDQRRLTCGVKETIAGFWEHPIPPKDVQKQWNWMIAGINMDKLLNLTSPISSSNLIISWCLYLMPPEWLLPASSSSRLPTLTWLERPLHR